MNQDPGMGMPSLQDPSNLAMILRAIFQRYMQGQGQQQGTANVGGLNRQYVNGPAPQHQVDPGFNIQHGNGPVGDIQSAMPHGNLSAGIGSARGAVAQLLAAKMGQSMGPGQMNRKYVNGPAPTPPTLAQRLRSSSGLR